MTDSPDKFLPVGLLAVVQGSSWIVLKGATGLSGEEEECAEAGENNDDYCYYCLELRSTRALGRLTHRTDGVVGSLYFVCYRP